MSDILQGNHNWMSTIKEATTLAQISMPGSHDSAATKGNIWVQTQSARIEDQLINGVRYLDIRCREINGVFAIHHGAYYLDLMFGDVLNIVQLFLKSNPSETVLMRIKQEYSSVSNKVFTSVFRSYLDRTQYSGLFYSGGDNPTIAQMRGKIVFLLDFIPDPYLAVGMRYSYFEIQDESKFTSYDNKMSYITALFKKTNDRNGTLRAINHLSATSWDHDPSRVSNIIRQRTEKDINDKQYKYIGIIPSDFIGRATSLINTIKECNTRANNVTDFQEHIAAIKDIRITNNGTLHYGIIEVDIDTKMANKHRYTVTHDYFYIAECYKGQAYGASISVNGDTTTLTMNKILLPGTNRIAVNLSYGSANSGVFDVKTLKTLVYNSYLSKNVSVSIIPGLSKENVITHRGGGEDLDIMINKESDNQIFYLVYNESRDAYQIWDTDKVYVITCVLKWPYSKKVFLYFNLYEDEQYWRLEKQMNGQYIISSYKDKDLVFDLYEKPTEKITIIKLASRTEATNQQFEIIDVRYPKPKPVKE